MLIVAALLAALPSTLVWPAPLSASLLLAVGAMATAWSRLRMDRMTRRVPGPATNELENDMAAHRSRTGMTQGQLAAAASVTRKTINTIENGHCVPSTVLALRIARALGVAVEEVFCLAGEQRAPAGRALQGPND